MILINATVKDKKVKSSSKFSSSPGSKRSSDAGFGLREADPDVGRLQRAAVVGPVADHRDDLNLKKVVISMFLQLRTFNA